MPPPPPQLMDELVEEILLRLPPDSPASLVRAGLVCKRWCHLVSDPGFQRSFREHHRTPPILGFLEVDSDDDDDDDDNGHTCTYTTSFVPKPASGLQDVDHPALRPRECRHGRVLLYSNLTCFNDDDIVVVIWDPITGKRVQLPNPPLPPPPLLLSYTWTAAVLCAAAAAPSYTCDHLDCHGGPFIVVLVVQDVDRTRISSYVYSSETGAWSEPTSSLPHSGGDWIGGWMHSSLLVGNALYFVPLWCKNFTYSILQYDLGTREIKAINPPQAADMDMNSIVELIATKDGGLGFVSAEDTKLSLWSREVVGDGRWALCQVIDLEKLFPRASTSCLRSGSAEDTGVIFLRVQGSRLVSIDLWSGLVTEVDGCQPPSYNVWVVPYMAFFTPVLSRPLCKDGGTSDSASSSA